MGLGGGLDGRTDERAETSLPLLRSWGHNNP